MRTEYTGEVIQRVTPLELIALRPGMHRHPSLNSFHALVAYLAGYRNALENHPSTSSHGDNLVIPDDFHDFVRKHFDSKEAQRWNDLIEQHTTTPEEAVLLLLQLRLA